MKGLTDVRNTLSPVIGWQESRRWTYRKEVRDGKMYAVATPPTDEEGSAIWTLLATMKKDKWQNSWVLPAAKRGAVTSVMFELEPTQRRAEAAEKRLNDHVRRRGCPAPGDLLWRDHMAPGALTNEQMAAKTGVSIGLINMILNARARVSDRVDEKFSKTLGTPVGFWLRAQSKYEAGRKGKKK